MTYDCLLKREAWLGGGMGRGGGGGAYHGGGGGPATRRRGTIYTAQDPEKAPAPGPREAAPLSGPAARSCKAGRGPGLPQRPGHEDLGNDGC